MHTQLEPCEQFASLKLMAVDPYFDPSEQMVGPVGNYLANLNISLNLLEIFVCFLLCILDF